MFILFLKVVAVVYIINIIKTAKENYYREQCKRIRGE